MQNRFSPEAQKAAIGMVEVAYRAKLVTSRDELSRIDSLGDHGAHPGRHQRARFAPQRRPSGARRVLDLQEATTELDRFASVPGNLLPDSRRLLRRAVLRLAKRQLRANLTINLAETEARRRAAFDAVEAGDVSIKKGQKVIGDGELISETHLVVVRSMREQTDELDMLQLQLGGAGVVAVVIARRCGCFPLGLSPLQADAEGRAVHGHVVARDAGADAPVGHDLGRGARPLRGDADRGALLLLPDGGGAMLVRFVLPQELSMFFAIVVSCLSGVMLATRWRSPCSRW